MKNLDKKKLMKYIYSALTIVFASTFLFTATYLIIYFINSDKQAKQNDALAGMVEQVQQEMGSDIDKLIEDMIKDSGSVDIDTNNPLLNNNNVYIEVLNEAGEYVDVLREYASIYQINNDMVGWIKIPGTKVNYPVVQSDEANFYLKRDFYKQSARHGTIYANEMADFHAPSDNITLYGHNMGDGSMFAGLHAYADPNFYAEHPYIIFDTLSSHQIYKVIYVFEIDLSKVNFAYHDFTDGDSLEFNMFIEECKELAMYDTGDTAIYGNKLLTLSTCDDNIMDDNIRFVVVAKKTSL